MKMILIDGNSLMFRAYYATAYSGNLMRNSKGQYTNALYGFVNMMNKLINENKYTHILVAFDTSKKTFRHEEYDEYKAGRAKVPVELIEQIPLIKEYLDVINVKRYELEGYEADDILGTFAQIGEQNGFDKIEVISGDKDLLQLIDNKTNVLITRKGISDIEVFDKEHLYEVFKINPRLVPDLKGLMGDSSDNLPGIPGVGEKTAIKLLTEYGSLDSIIQNKDKIKGKLGERISEHYELALMCRKMATIERDVPLDITLKDIENKSIDEKRLIDFYKEMEFNTFAKRLSIQSNNVDNSSFTYKIIEEKDIFSLEDILLDRSSIHVETFGENYHKTRILGFGISNVKGNYFLPYELMEQSFSFGEFLADKKRTKYTYDYKMGKVALKWKGYEFNGVTFDLLLAAYLINPLNTKEDIGSIALIFDYNGVDFDEEVYGKGAKKHIPDLKQYALHAVKKAVMIKELKHKMEKQLTENNQFGLFQEIELPLSSTLADMEFVGMKVSKEKLEELKKEFDERILQLEHKIYSVAGEEFNIKSTQQLGHILFEKMGLPSYKKTKTGFSTNVDVLNKLIDKHPIIQLILDYRELTKLYSTYLEGLNNTIFEDGKVHTIFKQAATATGRLSSIEPNLQNIPIRSEEGRRLRKMFIPSQKDNVLLSADYSQIELRVLADISNTTSLIEAFKNRLDIHTKTAMDIFGVEEVSSNLRRQAKAVNFGIIYGISAWSLGEDVGLTTKQAERFIENYLKTYPGIKKYMDSTIQSAYNNGYVSTIMNRRRYIKELESKNYMTRKFGERTAMNAPIQGSAADIIKKAMIDIDSAIKKKKLHSRLIVQVHDELIFDVPIKELDIMKELVRDVMEHTVQLKVPLTVDINYGNNWYEAK